MKTFLIAAAAVCGVALSAPAMAQNADRHAPMQMQHSEHRTTTTVRETHVERHNNNGWRGPKWTKKKVCRTVWRNHHRVRHCNWQRVRVR